MEIVYEVLRQDLLFLCPLLKFLRTNPLFTEAECLVGYRILHRYRGLGTP